MFLGKVFKIPNRIYSGSGRNCLMGLCQHLVWKEKDETAKLVTMHCPICYLYVYMLRCPNVRFTNTDHPAPFRTMTDSASFPSTSSTKRCSFWQGFGCVFIWYGSWSSILDWIPIRIRIQGFIWPKNWKKFIALIQWIFFDQKLQFTYSCA